MDAVPENTSKHMHSINKARWHSIEMPENHRPDFMNDLVVIEGLCRATPGGVFGTWNVMQSGKGRAQLQ